MADDATTQLIAEVAQARVLCETERQRSSVAREKFNTALGALEKAEGRLREHIVARVAAVASDREAS